MRAAFEWFVPAAHGELAVLDNLCTAAIEAEGTDHDRPEFAIVRRLSAQYPGDPGIAVSVLLNYVSLSAGEALFLPAGNIHAYLSGLGIELMASSDNVLRGGLTPKHVDVPELMSVLNFSPLPVPYLRAEPLGGARVYAPEGVALALAHVTGSATLRPDGPAVLISVGGTTTVTGAVTSATVRRGESVLVTADEGELTFSGNADVYLAASALRGPSAT